MITFSTFESVLRRLGAILVIRDDGIVVIHTSVLDFLSNKERCGEETFEPLADIETRMTHGCFEIMAHGTRNAKRQMNRSPPGLCFNICGLETSYLENSEIPDLNKRISQRISAELRYSSLHWLDHLNSIPQSRAAENEAKTHLSAFFEGSRSLYWLEVLSLLGKLETGRELLIRFLKQTGSSVSINLTNGWNLLNAFDRS